MDHQDPSSEGESGERLVETAAKLKSVRGEVTKKVGSLCAYCCVPLS